MLHPKTPAHTNADYRPYAYAVLEVMRERGALNTLHAPILIAFVHDSGGLTIAEIAEYFDVPEAAIATHLTHSATAA